MNKTGLWLIILALVAGCLLCCMCLLGAGAAFYFMPTAVPTIIPLPTEKPSPTSSVDPSNLDTRPAPAEAYETQETLQTTDIPDSDLHELAIRFRDVPADTPRQLNLPAADYPVGTERVFNVSNVDTNEQFQVTAVLAYKTPHLYMWVEKGVSYNERKLKEAADLFEQVTYPTNREFFGSEWTPGVDGDPHLSVLHVRGLGDTVAGYFSSPDEFVLAVREDSNVMEMFYINLDNVTIGDDFYNGVLAHEFQHMIHWYNDRNEDTWMNEGASELAMELNNRQRPGKYDTGGSDYSYLVDTDIQLTTWPDPNADTLPHYGAAYLFMAYFLDRFGENASKALIAEPRNGMESVDYVLQNHLNLNLTHKDVFADWAVANLIDDPDIADGRYGYRDFDPMSPGYAESHDSSDLPITAIRDVAQYGVDAIELRGEQPVTFNFTGSNTVKVLDTYAHSGLYLWWSNRNDESDSRLLRLVSLPQAQNIALSFWAWYDIEEEWDYAYLVVGTAPDGSIGSPDDPDITWHILDDSSLGCTTSNPNFNAFGCGWTGTSDGWRQLSADLTRYAGQDIVLAFEYITDAAVNLPGLALDDITLTADGKVLFSDDGEAGAKGWIAQGFARIANVLPQEWIVQLVTFPASGKPTVQRLLDGNQGSWTIPLSADTPRAVILVSALAPVTTERGVYQYELTVKP